MVKGVERNPEIPHKETTLGKFFSYARRLREIPSNIINTVKQSPEITFLGPLILTPSIMLAGYFSKNTNLSVTGFVAGIVGTLAIGFTEIVLINRKYPRL